MTPPSPLGQTTITRDSASNSVNTISQATGSNGTDPKIASNFTYDTASSAPYAPFYPKTAQNPQLHTTTYGYDATGNVTDVTDDKSPPADHVHLGYDPAHPGRLTSVTDANSHTTNYGYDAQGNLTSMTPPSPLGPTTITYDSLSRIATVTDGKNQKRTYGYDNLDRVTSIAFADSSGNTVATVTFSYDNDGNLTQRTDPNGTSAYAHDALNGVTQQTYPGSLTNTYAYDPVGNLTSLTDGGGTVNYAYDSTNLLSSLADPGGSCTSTPKVKCTTFTYDKDGQRLTTTYPSGVTLTNKYDNADRLTCVMATQTAPPSACDQQASPLRRSVYTFVSPSSSNTSPLRASVTDQAANKSDYTYDALDRLTHAVTKNSGGSVTDDRAYTYDAAGNRTVETSNGTVTNYSYNSANEPTGTGWSFDSNGNELSKPTGDSFSYNALDQTSGITPSGGSIINRTYLGPGQSELASIVGFTTIQNNVLGLGARTTTGTTYYTRDESGRLIGERMPDGTTYNYVFDGLGSVIGL
ncbi:MAG TPA: hypothetical protein VKJ07_13575, partial [Mycobacteriales bacterium]|nr:hypothetical protein [Mycobacteriales bacterium]